MRLCEPDMDGAGAASLNCGRRAIRADRRRRGTRTEAASHSGLLTLRATTCLRAVPLGARPARLARVSKTPPHGKSRSHVIQMISARLFARSGERRATDPRSIESSVSERKTTRQLSQCVMSFFFSFSNAVRTLPLSSASPRYLRPARHAREVAHDVERRFRPAQHPGLLGHLLEHLAVEREPSGDGHARHRLGSSSYARTPFSSTYETFPASLARDEPVAHDW